MPPKPPRHTPPQCPQHEDREFDEVFIGTNENAASWAGQCEVPPRPPPRTLSLQTSSTTTKGDVADNSYDNVQPNKNSPNPENDDQIPISPVQTEQATMTADSDVPETKMTVSMMIMMMVMMMMIAITTLMPRMTMTQALITIIYIRIYRLVMEKTHPTLHKRTYTKVKRVL